MFCESVHFNLILTHHVKLKITKNFNYSQFIILILVQYSTLVKANDK